MELDEKNDVVRFKSLPEFFYQERSGAKSNTIRLVTQDEYNAFSGMLPERIVITNVATGASFVREISSLIVVNQSIGVSVSPGMVLILVSWWS